MKLATTIIRVLLGLLLIVFGLNKFLNFMPPPEVSVEMGAFMMALSDTGYLMELVGALEVVGGLLILIKKYLPLGLVLVFPIMLNALLAHLFLDIAGTPASALLVIMIVFLFFVYKERFQGILKA